MEQVTVLIPNRDKAQLLIELLHSLDFITDIQLISGETNGRNIESPADENFFSLAGIWADRDISAESIRKEAWPER
ncbi:MAG: hypothetical protein KJZ86_11970 [Caldilineaceae bacterium]|nr:hypothetical protein [Caldilineaceae bacterium]